MTHEMEMADVIQYFPHSIVRVALNINMLCTYSCDQLWYWSLVRKFEANKQNALH